MNSRRNTKVVLLVAVVLVAILAACVYWFSGYLVSRDRAAGDVSTYYTSPEYQQAKPAPR